MRATRLLLCAFLTCATPSLADVTATGTITNDDTSSGSTFATRCAAAGVTVCEDFESSASIESHDEEDCNGNDKIAYATDQALDGVGSAKFTYTAGVGCSNIAGSMTYDIGTSIDPGEDLYVQVAVRVDSQFTSNMDGAWGSSSKKMILIHGASSRCQGMEYTTILESDGPSTNAGYTTAYNSCGDGFQTSTTDNTDWDTITIGGGDGLLEQGYLKHTGTNYGYNCHYQGTQPAGAGNGDSGCFYWPPNTWIYLTVHVRPGTCGSSNGTQFEGYATVVGSDRTLQWQHATPKQECNIDSALDKVVLDSYMTEIAGSAGSTAFGWYDNLIISTQPIAAPEGSYVP